MRFYRDEYDDQFNDEFNSRNYDGRIGDEFNSRRINGKFEGKFEDVINSREFEEFKRKHGIPDELFESLDEGEVQEIIEDNGNRRVIKRVVKSSFTREQPMDSINFSENFTIPLGSVHKVNVSRNNFGGSSFNRNNFGGFNSNYSGFDSLKKKKAPASLPIVIIVGIYLLISTVINIMLFGSNGLIAANIALTSNFFVIIGLIFIYKNKYTKEQLAHLTTILPGIVATIFALLASSSTDFDKQMFFNFIAAPYALLVGSIFYIIASVIRHKNKTKHCTVEVEAYVVDHSKISSRRANTLRAAIYQFVLNGQTYRVKSEKYKGLGYDRLNTRTVLNIDPDDPEHIYETYNESVMLKVVLGVIVMAVSGIICTLSSFAPDIISKLI